MMGRQEAAAELFYRFSLETHVPAEHLLRRVDAVLDLSFVRQLGRALQPHGPPLDRPRADALRDAIGYLYRIPVRDAAR